MCQATNDVICWGREGDVWGLVSTELEVDKFVFSLLVIEFTRSS